MIWMSFAEKRGKDLVGVMCKKCAESNLHLGVECSFTKSVWFELETTLRLKNLWIGDSAISCFKTRCLNKDLKHIISLLVLVFWFT